MDEKVFAEKEKHNLRKVLIPDTMSSEEEVHDDDGERYFKRRKPEWRTKKFQKLVDIIDVTYEKSSSKRSKEQMVKRVNGSPSKRAAPANLPFGYDMFVSKK